MRSGTPWALLPAALGGVVPRVVPRAVASLAGDILEADRAPVGDRGRHRCGTSLRDDYLTLIDDMTRVAADIREMIGNEAPSKIVAFPAIPSKPQPPVS